MSDTRPADPAGVPSGVLSVVSHELRGPLGVARGYLRLLEAQLDPSATARQPVTQAARALTRMAELLDEVSEYARWTRGELTLVRGNVRLRDVITGAVTAAAHAATTHVTVEMDAAEDAGIEADSQRLAGALAALVVALARTVGEDNRLVIFARVHAGRTTVTLAPEHLRDAATEDRAPTLSRAGAGLTIALADLIVQRHGGRLVERWADREWAGYRCELKA